MGYHLLIEVHYAFWYISLPSMHDNDVKLPNFTFCGGLERKTTTLFFLMQSMRIQLQKNSPTFDELRRMEYARCSLKAHEHTF